MIRSQMICYNVKKHFTLTILVQHCTIHVSESNGNILCKILVSSKGTKLYFVQFILAHGQNAYNTTQS